MKPARLSLYLRNINNHVFKVEQQHILSFHKQNAVMHRVLFAFVDRLKEEV